MKERVLLMLLTLSPKCSGDIFGPVFGLAGRAARAYKPKQGCCKRRGPAGHRAWRGCVCVMPRGARKDEGKDHKKQNLVLFTKTAKEFGNHHQGETIVHVRF